MRSGFFASLLLVLLACSAGTTLPHAGDRGIPALPQQTFETFFYLRNNDEAIRSFAAHAQHAGGTTPGPVAGLPWMREMMDWVLAQGVAPEKISLGIPSYSDYWLPTYSEESGARVRGRDISFARANELAGAAGAEWTWSGEQGVAYAFWRRNVTFDWIFREDARSFGLKLDLMGEYAGLRGISVWVLGSEDPGIWDVLAARR